MKEKFVLPRRGVNTHSLSLYPALGAGDAPFVKKAPGQRMTVSVSLCGYVGRDKSVHAVI